MGLSKYIESFCKENNDKYEIYKKYSGKFMFGKTCLGIVVRNGFSYMTMLIQLTQYLDEHDCDDVELELTNPAIDSLGLDIIVYFPALKYRDE